MASERAKARHEEIYNESGGGNLTQRMAFDGIKPDPVLSQDVEMRDAALASDGQPESAWSEKMEGCWQLLLVIVCT